MPRTRGPSRRRRAAQRGQVLPIVGILFVVIAGITGLAIDAGHNYLDRRTAQNATDAAALASGQTLAASGTVLTSPPTSASTALKTAAHDFAANNGFNTVLNNSCDTSTSDSFTTSWTDGSTGCAATTGYVTKVTFNDPPCGVPVDDQDGANDVNDTVPFPFSSGNCAGIDSTQELPTSCNPEPYNCLQIVISYRTTNFIMGIFGQPYTYTTTAATVFAQPPNPGNGEPPPTAVYLYQLQDQCDPSPSVQCFNQGAAPAKPSAANLSCTGGGSNCPTLWAVHGSAPRFYGFNGATLTPATHVPTVQSNGDVFLDDNSVFCDSYDAANPPTTTCSPNAPVGADGFAINTTSISKEAKLYCKGYQGGVNPKPTVPLPCTTTAGGAYAVQGTLAGNESAFSSQSFTVNVDTSKATNCNGGLILNGESIATAINDEGLNTSCIPQTGDEFTIQPGVYSYIVINHGQYDFGAGTYYITGTAPVDTHTGPGQYANGIDHGNETSPGAPGYGGDFDLCNGGQPNSCPNLTAGVWIGHGKLQSYAFTTGTATSCANGVSGVGTQSGGGDQTIIGGAGLTFKFGPNAGGFVSTSEVQSISLIAPGPGASKDITPPVPVLFDLENGSFLHLDGMSQSSNTFQGIIYQDPVETSGGVELDPGLNNGNPSGTDSAVTGQILAYSLTTFGKSGNAVDFRGGYGTSALPLITNSGRNETEIVTSASLKADQTGTNAVFTLHYTDEWALDAYDAYVIVGSYKPVFFSQGMWDTATPSSQPDEPNTGNPSDRNPSEPTNATGGTFPTVNTGNPAGSYNSYTTKLDPVTNQYSDYTLSMPFEGGGTATFEVSGDWWWGHEQSSTNNSMGNPDIATLTYTFPVASLGNTTQITMGLYDGDHCGDYAVYSGTFNTPGQPGGGQQTNGEVLLEQ